VYLPATYTFTTYWSHLLQSDVALAVDAVSVVTRALKGMVKSNSKVFQSTFRRGTVYNYNRTKGIPCSTDPPVPWMHGEAIIKHIKQVRELQRSFGFNSPPVFNPDEAVSWLSLNHTGITGYTVLASLLLYYLSIRLRPHIIKLWGSRQQIKRNVLCQSLRSLLSILIKCVKGNTLLWGIGPTQKI